MNEFVKLLEEYAIPKVSVTITTEILNLDDFGEGKRYDIHYLNDLCGQNIHFPYKKEVKTYLFRKRNILDYKECKELMLALRETILTNLKDFDLPELREVLLKIKVILPLFSEERYLNKYGNASQERYLVKDKYDYGQIDSQHPSNVKFFKSSMSLYFGCFRSLLISLELEISEEIVIKRELLKSTEIHHTAIDHTSEKPISGISQDKRIDNIRNLSDHLIPDYLKTDIEIHDLHDMIESNKDPVTIHWEGSGGLLWTFLFGLANNKTWHCYNQRDKRPQISYFNQVFTLNGAKGKKRSLSDKRIKLSRLSKPEKPTDHILFVLGRDLKL